MTSVKNNNMLPPGLVSNLQQVLLSRKGGGGGEEEEKKSDPSNDDNDKSTEPSTSTCVENTEEESNNSKPIVLVTNGDGIDSPGLVSLVEALVREGLYNVHVCAPQSDKSVSSHSVTLQETIAVTSAEINGAIAYEVSGFIRVLLLELEKHYFVVSHPCQYHLIGRRMKAKKVILRMQLLSVCQ